MSIEIESLGNHDRAFVYKGLANYQDIIQAEVSGDFIKRVSSAEEERGHLLVMGKFISPGKDTS